MSPAWEMSKTTLIAARSLVDSLPERLAGTPVIRGTRVPVYDVAASVAASVPIKRILSAYPGLNLEKIELATLFVEAYPPQGRPRPRAELPKGAVIVSDRRVSRRKKARGIPDR
jgi:uncharacterized protein (DUF433 family)